MKKVDKEIIKSIIFRLKDDEYALPVSLVASIERMMKMTRVPGTPHFVKGVLNLRGVVTPLIDLRTRFKFEELGYNESTRIIMIKHQNMDVGLIVDAAYDVIDIPKEAIESADIISSVDTDYINGIAKYDDRLLILIDIDKILSKEAFTNNLAQLEKQV